MPTMAKKKKKKAASSAASKKRRKRRSPDEIIRDLQDEIRRVRSRQTQRELQESPCHKAAISAVRSIDKALKAAADEGETALRHALADARKAVGTSLEEKGLRLPKANLPKGPRPRGTK